MCDEKKKENFFKNFKNNFFYIKKFPLKSRNKENVKSLRKKEQFIIKFIIKITCNLHAPIIPLDRVKKEVT